MSVSLAMEHLASGIDSLVQLRDSQRRAGRWDDADVTRRTIDKIRIANYCVQINDSKNDSSWHWRIMGEVK